MVQHVQKMLSPVSFIKNGIENNYIISKLRLFEKVDKFIFVHEYANGHLAVTLMLAQSFQKKITNL